MAATNEKRRSWGVWPVRCALFVLLLPILFAGYRLADWHRLAGHCVAISGDGRFVATSYYRAVSLNQSYLEVRSLANGGKTLAAFLNSQTTTMDFAPNGALLAAAHTNGAITLWNPATGKQVASYRLQAGRLRSLEFSRNGQSLIVGADAGVFQLDAKTGRLIASLRSPPLTYWVATQSPDGDRLAVGAYDTSAKAGEVRIYALRDGQFVQIGAGPKTFAAPPWTADGKRLIASDGTQWRLWNVANEKFENGFPANQNITVVAVTHNGKLIAATGNASTIEIWDARTGVLLRELAGPGDMTLRAAFTGDSKTLAATSHDGKTTLWDVSTGQRLAVFWPDGSTYVWLACLLAAFLLWCVVWVRSGVQKEFTSRPLWDVVLLNGIILAALMLRMLAGGRVDSIHRWPFPLLLGALASAGGLLAVWMMMGGHRWALRVPAFLAGVALVWTIPLFLWEGAYEGANFEIAVSAFAMFGFIIVLLAVLMRFGIRIGRDVDGETFIVGGDFGGQFSLRDVLLWTAAAALLFAVGRFVSPQTGSLAGFFFLVENGMLVALTIIVAFFCGLSKRPYLLLPFALAMAVFAGWTPPWPFMGLPVLPDWWYIAMHLAAVALMAGSLLVFRAHGYMLKQVTR